MGLWHIHPVIDPDFDDFEGLAGLTCAQIRNPIPLEFGEYQDLHQAGLDKKRWIIHRQRRQLERLSDRLHRVRKKHILLGRERLHRDTEWLRYRMKWQLWYLRKRLRIDNEWLQYRMKWKRWDHARQQ